MSSGGGNHRARRSSRDRWLRSLHHHDFHPRRTQANHPHSHSFVVRFSRVACFRIPNQGCRVQVRPIEIRRSCLRRPPALYRAPTRSQCLPSKGVSILTLLMLPSTVVYSRPRTFSVRAATARGRVPLGPARQPFAVSFPCVQCAVAARTGESHLWLIGSWTHKDHRRNDLYISRLGPGHCARVASRLAWVEPRVGVTVEELLDC